MEPETRQPGSSGARHRWRRADGQLPVVGRIFPAPVAAKVPEIIFLFWVVKILTTAGGEVTSDYLKKYGNFGGGGTEVALFVIALVLQFATRRYRAFAYWSLAYAIAIAGTGLSDFLHLDVHIPYAGTSLMWAVILAIHVLGLVPDRRNALDPQHHHPTTRGVLLGGRVRDLRAGHRARRLHRHLAEHGLPGRPGMFFFGVILLPALGWWRFGLNSVVAFWTAYVVTRPLGASFADWFSKPAQPDRPRLRQRADGDRLCGGRVPAGHLPGGGKA